MTEQSDEIRTVNSEIIVSIFKEDNVFSITASLPHGPPVNTDIDDYQTFSDLSIFASVVRLVVRYFVRRREAGACLIMLSTKQGRHWYHFNAFGMARPGFETTTSRFRSGCSTTEPAGPVKSGSYFRVFHSHDSAP